MMYRPVFDMQKSGLIENVLTRAERVNAETPWVAGYTLDDAKTELHMTVELKKPAKRAFHIRLEPVVPHTNYTEDREFKEERKTQMNHLAAYLQELLDTEKTYDQHIQLDRTGRAQQKNIEEFSRVLSGQAAYDATVSYTGSQEYLTVSISHAGSALAAPLMQLVSCLVHPGGLDDAETLVFKKNRNDRLAEISRLLADLVIATKKETI